MLNRAVCKKCVNRHRLVLTNSRRKLTWDAIDDISWDAGKVNCTGPKWTKIDIDPPVGCPYKFEHAVSVGMINVK
jgi:hypothetical protein